MARNRIQFQKGLSEAGFVTLYGIGDDGGARCDDALRQALHPAAPEAGDAA